MKVFEKRIPSDFLEMNRKALDLGLKLGGARLDSVPRKFTRNSSDKQFLAFHRRDPLQAQTVPSVVLQY